MPTSLSLGLTSLLCTSTFGLISPVRNARRSEPPFEDGLYARPLAGGAAQRQKGTPATDIDTSPEGDCLSVDQGSMGANDPRLNPVAATLSPCAATRSREKAGPSVRWPKQWEAQMQRNTFGVQPHLLSVNSDGPQGNLRTYQ